MKEDLDRKERAVPPGIEIPGIPAQKNGEYLSLGFSSTIYTCYTEYIHIEN